MLLNQDTTSDMLFELSKLITVIGKTVDGK